MKSCTKCGVEKPVGDFSKNSSSRDGLRSNCKSCQRSNYVENQVRRRTQKAEYYIKNRDKKLQYNAEYRAMNRDKLRKQAVEYNARNHDKRAEYRANRSKIDPLWTRLSEGAARTRKVGGLVDKFNSGDLLSYWESVGIPADQCYYCSGPFEHLDHMTPTSKGGAHSVRNIVPSCATCNLTKADRTSEEFAKL